MSCQTMKCYNAGTRVYVSQRLNTMMTYNLFTDSMSGFPVAGLLDEWSVVRSVNVESRVIVPKPPASAYKRLLVSSSASALRAVFVDEKETVVRFVARMD